ncbi:amidinotransferase family protein [Paenibacillus larvae subsp. larvae]|uniref:Amidinotransferase family protein n=2 Tax=Paenibacillus larvae TaxID=1464 RepID=A0A2L1U1X8_9BACL|nr:hypothetical protein [Paenibacillus larvae]AQT83688.1 hypothetical protein B1222_03520 [Paenibacillus larvae subsp. pulvifaciens]AQZ48834.1 hypothetical protein B5S25_21870 [Paenibacillus larvae subsp. pulvifaciens]AVF26930.1 amidinotransferase family protein [Paenibacillus larvae subsp. larvae]AVF31679.1 amidinotransferase family protein [Paenibacillus larvae subsp. larvae]MDR5604843.1 hypothetical protein [Paenibacillus larvae]
MIICEEAFLEGIPESLKEWDKITVPLEDAQKLITNGLPLNEKVYVTDPEFQSSVGQVFATPKEEHLYVDRPANAAAVFYYGSLLVVIFAFI